MLHFITLWLVVVAHPLFDVLGRSPEFFVAHRTRPADVWTFVAILSLAVPVSAYGVVRASALVNRRLPALLTGLFVGTMVGALALYAGQVTNLELAAAIAGAALAAVAAAWVYVRHAAARSFVTWLSPVVVLVPALFLWQPGVRSQLKTTVVRPVALDMVRTPPVVVMVFDQLPLASLLDAELQVDDRQYPNFAAIGRDATWFRNASAVSGFTGWALPAIIAGQRPDNTRTPTAADYALNLFTLLGTRYRLDVFERMTSLCPGTLCESMAASMPRMLQDTAVLYLHLVAPGHLADRLPPVTQNWRDFIATDSAGARWQTERQGDRGPAVEAFIERLDNAADEYTPPLIFAHALLPHEPFIYLPSGQIATTRPTTPGYQSDGTWSRDVWAVTHTYQRHLAQVGYADTLLGALLTRLRTLGLYDDALIVVTADHGASFRLGHSVRSPTAEAPADVMAVPLFIKRPRQRAGSVDDRNVETIDVLPTILGVLGARAPASIDGVDVFAPGWTPRPAKRIALDGGGAPLDVDGNLLPSLRDAVRWRVKRFGERGSPFTPDVGEYASLVGRALSDVSIRPESSIEVVVDVPGLFASVDPAGDLVPAHVSGAIRQRGPGDDPVPLAVALNGVIRAIARPFSDPVGGRDDTWGVLLDPALFRPGDNRVEVLAILRQPDGGVVLERAWEPPAEAPGTNLILNEFAWLLGATLTGFHGIESPDRQPFRWTNGAARLTVPLDRGARPSELVVDVIMPDDDSHLRITANDCRLVDAPIRAPWSGRFAIDGCIDNDTDLLTIDIESETFVPRGSDQRTLGVAIARIELR